MFEIPFLFACSARSISLYQALEVKWQPQAVTPANPLESGALRPVLSTCVNFKLHLDSDVGCEAQMQHLQLFGSFP